MFFTSSLIALGAGLGVLSPAEWLVHKYLLHTPKHKRTFINRASSHAHHDIHHAAFMGPAHYYRDITNEHQVIHFSHGDVATILGVGAGAGFAGSAIHGLATGSPALGVNEIGATAGMIAAAAIGYLGYEVSHHYMHVIGERRLAINRALGDRLQEERDGRLRFTKPLLDDICNAIEAHVDENLKDDLWPMRYDASLESRFNDQLERNREIGNDVGTPRFRALMEDIGDETLHKERALHESMTRGQRVRYWVERKVQRLFRGSDTVVGRYFRHIDNHHFLHHYNYTKNLNVFITWADSLFDTKLDSSSRTLDTWNKKHLLCPNSPDTELFVAPVA